MEKFYKTIRPGGAHDYENKPPGGAGRSAKGDTGTTGTAVGTWMGKEGGEGKTGGKEEKGGLGRIKDPNKPNKTRQTPNTPVTDKKRGPTALGRTLVDNEVGEGSGGRGGHVKDEQEGGEVRDLSEEERTRKTKTCKGGIAKVTNYATVIINT